MSFNDENSNDWAVYKMYVIEEIKDLKDSLEKVKSNKKPSEFVAEQLKMKVRNIKKEQFINDFFATYSLTDAIKKHSQKCPKVKREILFFDLLT